MAYIVVPIATVRNSDRLLEILHIGVLVEKGQLHPQGGVHIVEEITPAFKYLGLILRLRQLVVNIRKLHGLGKQLVIHLAQTVLEHFPVGNRLLGGLGDFAVAFGFLYCGGKASALRAGQLSVRPCDYQLF